MFDESKGPQIFSSVTPILGTIERNSPEQVGLAPGEGINMSSPLGACRQGRLRVMRLRPPHIFVHWTALRDRRGAQQTDLRALACSQVKRWDHEAGRRGGPRLQSITRSSARMATMLRGFCRLLGRWTPASTCRCNGCRPSTSCRARPPTQPCTTPSQRPRPRPTRHRPKAEPQRAMPRRPRGNPSCSTRL